MDIIKELPADAKESSMHLIELVEYRGEKKGREEYKKSVVRNLLLKNADIDFICEVAEVSKEYVLEIQKKIGEKKKYLKFRAYFHSYANRKFPHPFLMLRNDGETMIPKSF